MPFTVKELPYAKEALEPAISRETVETHYEKHHKGYAAKLTTITEGKPEAAKTVEELVKTAAPGPVFNNAAQVWNHTFYWECMCPKGSEAPANGSPLEKLISQAFGSLEGFKKTFLERATGHFGSGWLWLVQNPAQGGRLEIMDGHDASNPMANGANLKPLLTVDVWEHAYYIDRRNRRPEYLEAWWGLINWRFVEAQLAH